MKFVFGNINNLEDVVDFILQPWAKEFQLTKGQELQVVGDFENEENCCQLDHCADCVVFHAWAHSLVQVKIDAKDVTRTSKSVRF